MLTRVAVLIFDRISPFELGVLCEVFGTERSDDGFPSYRFDLCSVDGGPVMTSSGFTIQPQAGLAPLELADLVAVPAHPIATNVPQEAAEALRRAHERGAWILSVCSGAFLLGQAGLLDGRRATTHWRYAADLAAQYPAAHVIPNELYVQDGRIITSAGTAAGIDACLHLVRQEHGAGIATKLARRMVVAPHRAGGQAQFIETPIPEAAQPHGPSHLRAPVPGRNRGQPARLAHPPACALRAPPAGGDRPAGRGGGGEGRLRRLRHAAAPLQQAGWHDATAIPPNL